MDGVSKLLKSRLTLDIESTVDYDPPFSCKERAFIFGDLRFMLTQTLTNIVIAVTVTLSTPLSLHVAMRYIC